MQITYKNKVTLQSNPNIPDENKVTAEDMNEIKSAVNSNEEEQQALKMSVQEIAQNVVNNSQEISNIKEEQTTQNENISALQTNTEENSRDITQIKTEQLTQNNNIEKNTNDINSLKERVSTNETNIASLQLESGNTLELSLNNTTYELTATLKNKAGTILSTSKVDFPVEQLVISVTYDSAKKELVITLKNGQVTRVPIGSIINGLVNQSDFDALVQTVQTKANQSDLNQTNTNVTNLAGRVSNNESKIENIEQEQTEQNTNISNNATNIESLQEENENLKKIVSQLPQVEGQGTSITLENTIEAQFTKFDVEGNSTQETTEGRNHLTQAEIKSVTSNGVTITSYADGKFTIKGTPTAAFFINFNFPTFDVPANAYFHLRNTGNVSYNYAIKIFYGSTEKGVYAFPSNNKIWQMNNEAYSANVFQFFCNSNAVGTALDITLQPSIELTDVATDYEKYTNGASPNPNYEQPIYSSGDNENIFDKDNEEQFLQNLTPDNNGLIVSAQTSTTLANYIRTIIIPCKSDANYAITRFLGGKTFFIYESDEYPTLNKQTTLLKRTNDAGKVSEIIKTSATAKYLLVKIYNTYASEYYSYDELISRIKIEKGNKASGYSPYGMGSINEKIQTRNLVDGVLDNSSSTTAKLITKDMNVLVPAGTYTISFTNKPGQSNANIYSGSTNILNIPWYSDKKTFTLTEPTLITRITCDVGANQIVYAQLEPGSTATQYVPHKEQDYSIFVQQPFRSIGDVRDCFVKKSDGKLYERHYIGEKILNGTENWLEYSSNMYLYIEDFILSEGQNNYVPTNYLSDYFTRNSLTNAIANPNASYLIQNVWGDRDKQRGVAIRVNDTFTDLATLKTWLTSHNTKLQYELAEPLDLPCTEEQIQQLENKPSTYKDFTIIQSQDETEAYLEVSGIRDIDTMFDKVTNAIVSLGGNV